jgi:hypothetical protein
MPKKKRLLTRKQIRLLLSNMQGWMQEKVVCEERSTAF